MDLASFTKSFHRICDNIEQSVRGKRSAVEQALACLVAEGHLLVEDVPGLGKTTLAKVLAISTGCSWKRIQCTPDLLPSDITGVDIFNRVNETFSFRPGAVFANIVVGDEINRASPKTQSALLEAMEERQVTVGGTTHGLARPFMVVATQNPIEMEGTYPLPEAQLDRFLMRLELGYPDLATESEILDVHGGDPVVADIGAVVTPEVVMAMIRTARAVKVDAEVRDYMVAVTAATRSMQHVRLGASPRGSLGLLRAGRAMAAADGRGFVIPEDVKRVAPSVLGHRLILKPEAELEGRRPLVIVEDVLDAIRVPRYPR